MTNFADPVLLFDKHWRRILVLLFNYNFFSEFIAQFGVLASEG